ncbi:MAG: 30S ribosomal protein S7 [Promethearchaeota archaeon]
MSKTKKEDIKLFNKWSFDGIEIKDFSLEKYINLKKIIVPSTGGNHSHKKFWKSQKVSIVERFINRLLSPGFIDNKIKGHKSSYNSGKKKKIIRSVEEAFTLIHLNTGQNPIQVLVDAIVNVAPREETTRIAMGGISYASAVDISPQRRVDLALKLLVQAIATDSHNTIRRFEESITRELISAAQNSQESKAIKRKDEIERIAVSAR